MVAGGMFLTELFVLALFLNNGWEKYTMYGIGGLAFLGIQIIIILYILNKKINKEIEETELNRLRKNAKNIEAKLKKKRDEINKKERKIETEKSFIRAEKEKIKLWTLQPEKKILGAYLQEIEELKDAIAKKEDILANYKKNTEKREKKQQMEAEEKIDALNQRIRGLERQIDQIAWKIETREKQLTKCRKETDELRYLNKKAKRNKEKKKHPKTKKSKKKKKSHHKQSKSAEKDSGIYTVHVPKGEELRR